MGVVYLARQTALDRRVALKLLAPERADDPVFAARFAKEAQALARLHHPHIVSVHDFGRAGGYYYLLMEFVDGASLRRMEQAGRLSPAEALAIVPQICDALQYAHERGVVHRDIKPENILVDRSGRVKVADFGLARLAADAAENEEADVVMGTPGYMAPEQRVNPGLVDHRADIYALGAVFYEMLTGSRPASPIASPSRQVRIDVRLDEVVLRALEKEPERRWQQASEVKTRLEALSSAPLSRPAAPARSGARIALAAGGACIAVFLAWNFAREKTPEAKVGPMAVAPGKKEAAGTPVNLASHFTPRRFGEKDVSRALETLSGEAIFDGLRFRVDGQITLAGNEFKSRNPAESYPSEVKGIALGGRRFDELHLLHVTYWENPHGEPVATIRFRYENGDTADFPLRYGLEVRDWSKRNSEERERLENPESKIVKRDLRRNQHQATTRITKTRLMNPRPRQPVREMELIAAPGLASYSLLAATMAESDPRREATPGEPFDQDERAFEREMVVKVVDRETGAPVAGQLIAVGGDFSNENVMAEPVRTGASGEARVRYPWRDSLRTWRLTLWLRDEGGATGAWMSWKVRYPRTAYFFVDGGKQSEGDLERLSDGLPEWRRPIARDLLAELGRNAIFPTRSDARGRVVLSDEDAWDDLGSLAQGTRGAVLFKAAAVEEGGPEGSDYQNLELRDDGAYAALHGAKEAAKKTFLEWMWAQVEPDAEPLGDWKIEEQRVPDEFKPLNEAELAAAIDAVHAALNGKPYMNETASATAPEDLARRAATDALLELLRGTAVDHWLGTSSWIEIGQEKPIGASVRSHDLLVARIAELARRGAVVEIRIRNQERSSIRSSIARQLMAARETGELASILQAAENAGRAARGSGGEVTPR